MSFTDLSTILKKLSPFFKDHVESFTDKQEYFYRSSISLFKDTIIHFKNYNESLTTVFLGDKEIVERREERKRKYTAPGKGMCTESQGVRPLRFKLWALNQDETLQGI